MAKDFIENLALIGLTARIRRLNDKLMSTGRNVYKLLDIDIEPNWHLILLLLEEKGKQSVTEIAKTLDFSHPAVIKIVKKMLDRGYLISSKDKSDNRKQLLELSPKAIQKLPEFKEKWELIRNVHEQFFSIAFINELSKLEQCIKEKPIEQRTREYIESKQ